MVLLRFAVFPDSLLPCSHLRAHVDSPPPLPLSPPTRLPQTLLRVTCVFKSFTPAMAMDMLRAHDNTNSRTLEPHEVEKEMDELCEIAVLKRCQPSNFVLSYFPDDLGKSECYTFVSKLMQEEVYKLMLSDWKTTLEKTHKLRTTQVMDAVLRIQAFIRRIRARRVRWGAEGWLALGRRCMRCSRLILLLPTMTAGEATVAGKVAACGLYHPARLSWLPHARA